MAVGPTWWGGRVEMTLGLGWGSPPASVCSAVSVDLEATVSRGHLACLLYSPGDCSAEKSTRTTKLSLSPRWDLGQPLQAVFCHLAEFCLPVSRLCSPRGRTGLESEGPLSKGPLGKLAPSGASGAGTVQAAVGPLGHRLGNRERVHLSWGGQFFPRRPDLVFSWSVLDPQNS